MGWKESSEPVLTRLPSVKGPTGHVKFNTKLLWSGAVLLTYFILTNVLLFGMASGQDAFGQFRSILAGQQGSLLQLGIGPIVTASIVLQLLMGADLLGLDQNDPRDQAVYQGLQKFLVIVMTALTAIPLVFAGQFIRADPSVASSLGISLFSMKFLLFLQIFIGGIIILYLDEIVSKWGIGSGVGLFIVAGVSQRLVGGIYEMFTSWYGILVGNIEISLFTSDGLVQLLVGQGRLLAVFTTLFIFGLVVYAESTRVEIPLSHAKVKGARGRFPVKLVYASVMPMIFVRALQANLQFIGQMLYSQLGSSMPAWLGVYSSGQPVGGLFYYIAPIYSPRDWMWWSGSVTQEMWQVLLRVGVDITVMVVGGAIFALFWVDTTGMGPDSVADQILNSGMQVPGFRRNESVIEKIMERYIPYITILGGALVGILAVLANMLGTIGGVQGTGLLLMVSITYKLYEQMAEEQLMNNPRLRKLLNG